MYPNHGTEVIADRQTERVEEVKVIGAWEA